MREGVKQTDRRTDGYDRAENIEIERETDERKDRHRHAQVDRQGNR